MEFSYQACPIFLISAHLLTLFPQPKMPVPSAFSHAYLTTFFNPPLAMGLVFSTSGLLHLLCFQSEMLFLELPITDP